MDTLKYATQDNFRNLLGTDNYLEKYLPFFIQGMISETVSSIHGKKEIQALKEYEHIKYKELHKVVLGDDGIPALKKRGFKMPGYRPVNIEGDEEVMTNSEDP